MVARIFIIVLACNVMIFASVIVGFALAEPISQEDFDTLDIDLEPISEPETTALVMAENDEIPYMESYIIDKCKSLGISPNIIYSMIQRESNFDPTKIGDGGDSFGLMQVQPKWHSERMERLGFTDLLDPHQNIIVGLDYLEELMERYNYDLAKALTAYNRGHYDGFVTEYAISVMANAEENVDLPPM